MNDKLRVGIIGVGTISPAYIKGCRDFDILDLVACADLNTERAKTVAAENNMRALSVDDLLADPNIDIVLNLTIPAVHAQLNLNILRAGKHVYSEKPLATTLDEGRAILDAAQAANLRVGCAPDTFLFAPHQTARKLVDDGVIGKPVAAVGFMMSHGPEKWHPSPDFYYAIGGGPMMDMGPYYIACLVNLLGAATRVSGEASTSFPERIAADGHRIPVATSTHYTGTVEFASGAVATLITTFDVWGSTLPKMELYGELGSLLLPDPNGHNPREVKLFKEGDKAWAEQPFTYPDIYTRGIGVADMAHAIVSGRAHRASGELAYHTLEVMLAFETASRTGTYVQIESRPQQPARLPLDLPERALES